VAISHHTFLFADLVGFTALTASRGDDHAADVALDFHDRARRLLPNHRAEEVKTIGDGLMLRCHDPRLAIQLGLRMVDDLEMIDGFPPVRVGMFTGPAVQRGQDWYGTTVNVAARLCAAAGGGDVLVGEATATAAGTLADVAFQDRRLHWLKNVTQPIPARIATPRARSRFERLRDRHCAHTPPRLREAMA